MDTLWTPDGRFPRWERRLLWILPSIVFLVLMLLRWERYGDVQVDFGQEMFTAWAIAEGKHLYTDIAYFKGPFSPHFNALLLITFGVSIRTITLGNSALALGFAYGVMLLARKACTLAVASSVGSAFLLVFAFSVDPELSIFNFITPFVHELTHGLMLSVVTFLCLFAWERHRHSGIALLAGFCFGLTWLTRIEVAFSLSAACATWLWCMRREGLPLPRIVGFVGIFWCGAVCIIGIAVAALAKTMPWHTALRSTFASLDAVLHTPIASSPFFRMIGGWDRPAYSIAYQLVIAMVIGIWMFIAYAAADLWRLGAKGFAVCFAAVEIAMVLKLSQRLLPFIHGGGLTVITGILTLTAIGRLLLHPSATKPGARLACMLGIFSLCMLGKIFLAPSIRFYGFAHALPAYLLMIGTLLTEAPSIVTRRIGTNGAKLFLALLTITILIDIGGKARMDQMLAMRKTITIGSGADRFRVADLRSNAYFQEFLSVAPALIPSHATLTAIPEGAMINYLLRLPTGVPVMNFMRTEYIIFGKDRIEGDLFALRPDFILLTHKETSDFGIPLYGMLPEYGKDVMTWLEKEYDQIALFGNQPLTQRDSEGVALWRRRDL